MPLRGPSPFTVSTCGTSSGISFCALSLMPRPTALEVTVAPAMASICQGLVLLPCLTVFTAFASAVISGLTRTSSASKFFRNAVSVRILSPMPGVSRIDTTPMPTMHWHCTS